MYIFVYFAKMNLTPAFLNGDMLSGLRQPGKLRMSLNFANIHLYVDMYDVLE